MKKIRFFLALFVMMNITTNTFGQQETETIFSKTFKNGIPVQITNNRDKGYTIKFSNTKAPAGISVQSGSASYTTEDIWYLVGDANGFKMYSHNTGKKYALKLDGTAHEAAATMGKAEEATTLVLTKQQDNSYAISPKENPAMSFNMFGGAGRDIKLYSSEDAGGHWNFRVIDMSRPLTIKYNAELCIFGQITCF